jgi:hypothetical protein
MPPVTVTQGQSFTDTGGRAGVAQFNPNTGQRLSTGQSVTVNPVATTTPSSPTTSGTTSTGQAPVAAKPAPAVFSSSTANNFNNATVIPAMNTAVSGMQNQATANGYNDLTHFLPGETADAYNARAAVISKAKPVAPPAPALTASDMATTKIANTPDAGNQYFYDSTGNRVEQPIGTPPPSGYTTVAPASPTANGHTVIGTVNTTTGTTYQQYSDGTYGIAGANGQFAAPASATDYNNAVSNSPAAVLQFVQQKIASIVNGAVPLTDAQQQVVTALGNQTATDVANQTQANANYTGAATIAMNLYGMGNALSGIGFIKGTIDAGISKIATIQNDSALTIGKMVESFNTDNLKALYEQYNALQSNATAIDAHINNMQTQLRDNRDYQLKVQQFLQSSHQFDVTSAEGTRQFNINATETAKKDAFNQKINMAKLDIERIKANAYISNLNAKNAMSNFVDKVASAANGASGINTDGTVNLANMSKIMSGIPPGLQGTVREVANYQRPLESIKDAKIRETVAQLVAVVRPTFDTKQYAVANKYLKDYASSAPNTLGGTKTALGAMSGHLGELAADLHTVDNTPVGFVNAIENWTSSWNGVIGLGAERRAALGQLGAMKDVFSEENLKYLKGATGGEEASKRMSALFSGNISGDEAIGSIKAFSTAMTDKSNQLVANQKDSLGYIDPNHPIMDSQQAISLDKLNKTLGLNSTPLIPVLSQTPEGQIYMFRNNPQNEGVFQQAQAQATKILGRPASAAELLQAFPGMAGNSTPVSVGATSGSGSTPQAPEPTDFSTIDSSSQ